MRLQEIARVSPNELIPYLDNETITIVRARFLRGSDFPWPVWRVADSALSSAHGVPPHKTKQEAMEYWRVGIR